MKYDELTGLVVFGAACVVYALRNRLARSIRRRVYERGRRLTKEDATRIKTGNYLRFGNAYLPESSATQHFLTVGTTGSGKTLLQRRLMKRPLLQIAPGTDKRAMIFDAKGDTCAYLKKAGVTAPVFSLNPFHAPSGRLKPVAWDVASDVTSPARAMNLAASLIPQEKGGSNRYFTDAARQVVAAVIESFIRHSGSTWTFSDLVFGTLSQARIEQMLGRDADGRDILAGFFGDERTSYQVFTTIASRMAYFRPVAALWQRCDAKLSIRKWLSMESILLLGSSATAKTTLEAINEIVFRILVEEIDVQVNSIHRRTWIWIDEARLSGPLLRNDLLPHLAVKGRSRGAALVLAFQDMEGFKEAAGDKIAQEIIAQCSNMAILRLSSNDSTSWASRELGKYETLESFVSVSGTAKSISEQRVEKTVVLPSEVAQLPVTSKRAGLTGYFVSPERGVSKGNIPGSELQEHVLSDIEETAAVPVLRSEQDQWLREWTAADSERLGLGHEREAEEQTNILSVERFRKRVVRRGR